MLNASRFSTPDGNGSAGDARMQECEEREEGSDEEVTFVEKDPQSSQLLELMWMTQKSMSESCSALVPAPDCAGYRWLEGQTRSEDTMELTGAVTESSVGISEALEEEFAYGDRLGFPTTRRPVNYHREITAFTPAIHEWFEQQGRGMLGDYPLSADKRQAVECLLYTWKDVFNSDPETMPVTDLVMYTIPTYSHIRPWQSKDKVYTQKQDQWQKGNIPRLLEAGIISYCDSPWSARTKHPVKKD